MSDFYSELRLFRKQIIKSLIDIKLTQNDPFFFHETIVPSATYSPWRTDPDFIEVYKKSVGNTLLDCYRLYSLWSLVKQTNHLKGSVLEVGVYRGGSALVIGRASNNIGTVTLADTFAGVVKAGSNDTFYKGGEHSDSSVEHLKNLLSTARIANFKVLKGIFPDDFENTELGAAYRFCHIDVDAYRSAQDVFTFVWPRLAVKGVVVFDDYGFLGCEGITRMVDEIDCHDCIKIYNLTGQCILVKCS